MRTTILTAILLALAVQPALAIGGKHGNGGGNNTPKIGTLQVVNSSDQEVEVSVGTTDVFYSLEPHGGTQQFSVGAPNKTDVNVTARLPGVPQSATSKVATVQADKTTVATVSVSGSTVSIAVGKPGVAKLMREAGVALASTGGLLPLLWLGLLLGRTRQPRQSEPRQ